MQKSFRIIELVVCIVFLFSLILNTKLQKYLPWYTFI